VQRVAARHLEDVESSTRYVIELQADLSRIEGEIAELRAEVAGLSDAEALVPESPDLTAARLRLEDAESRLGRHQKVSGSLSELESERRRLQEEAAKVADALVEAKAAFEGAKVELEAARQALAALEADLRRRQESEAERQRVVEPEGRSAAGARSVRAARDARERERGELEWAILSRMAQLRTLSFVGSVPLLLDDALRNWPTDELATVLERVQRMSDVIQVIVLSDDVELQRWAREQGRHRAASLDFATV